MLDIHGTVDGICYLGMTSAKIFQYCTVAFQMAILGWFLIALGKEAAAADNPAGPMPDISWFDPTRIDSFSAFSAGLAVSIFVYWGWATVPAPGEETKVSRGPTSTESTAASILLILLVVVFVRHSSGDALRRRARRHRKQSWKSGHSRERVHGSRPPSDGPAAIFLSFAILLGAMASINSTAISPARKLLAFRKCAASWPGGRYQHTQTHLERA